MLKSRSLLLGCFLLFFAGMPAGSGYQVGDTVKDFLLKDVSGKMVSLADYKEAKGIILIFDCNTCPVSQAYQERIKALHAKYASQGYPVVAIQPNDPVRSPGDAYDNMVKYAKANNYQHAYLFDNTQEVTKRFGATNTPHVFVLNKENGDLVVKYIGAIDNNTRDSHAADKKYVEDAVDALLEGETVEVNKTKAIGCSIKWKS